MEDLPEDKLVFICNKLEDKDRLALSQTCKTLYQLVKGFFKEYLVIFKDERSIRNPLLIIEKSHPKFNKVFKNIGSNSDYYYHRFTTSYSNVYFTNFDYRLQNRSKPGDPKLWTSDEMKIYNKKNKIAKDNIQYIHENKEVAVNTLMNDLKTKVFDVLRDNNYVLYDANSDADDDPKTKEEYLMTSLNGLNEKNQAWFNFGGWSHYRIHMVNLDTSTIINLTTKGHWKELLGKQTKKKKIKKLLKKGTKYNIHDNGSRPFIVIHVKKKNNVHIFKKKYIDDEYKKFIYVPVKKYKNVERVLPGKDNNPNFIGNSVLVHISLNRYLYIGHDIAEFCTPDEEIVEYYSFIGNSDVPYPVAIGNTNAYFMLDNVYIPKCEFPEDIIWLDAYSWFYGHEGPEVKRTKTVFPNLELVHAREW